MRILNSVVQCAGTVVKSGYIEGGANISLREFIETAGNVCKRLRLQRNVQRLFADAAFGPTKTTRFSVASIKRESKFF